MAMSKARLDSYDNTGKHVELAYQHCWGVFEHHQPSTPLVHSLVHREGLTMQGCKTVAASTETSSWR